MSGEYVLNVVHRGLGLWVVGLGLGFQLLLLGKRVLSKGRASEMMGM